MRSARHSVTNPLAMVTRARPKKSLLRVRTSHVLYRLCSSPRTPAVIVTDTASVCPALADAFASALTVSAYARALKLYSVSVQVDFSVLNAKETLLFLCPQCYCHTLLQFEEQHLNFFAPIIPQLTMQVNNIFRFLT